ncbi:hypothetical protein J3459_008341 [Metarhizium acridum]|nr:hypothetical protein J3459_008341 [Metarhizium acridum]
MFNPGIAYMLACVVLFAIAVVIHYHTIHLSLPISSAITILSTILPITAFLNAYVYPNLLRSSHTFTSGDIFTRLAPIVLQGFQAIITAILATLLLEGVVPSPALESSSTTNGISSTKPRMQTTLSSYRILIAAAA